MGFEYISDNLQDIREKIRLAALKSGRDQKDIRLVVVGKTRSVDEISKAIAAGAVDFGENRVQELLAKQSRIDKDICWHFIGSLQRNKVKSVVGTVGLIQSVDRHELAVEIDKKAEMAGLVQSVLVEVNVAGELTKHGVDPKNIESFIAEVGKLRHISVEGVMTIAPLAENTESIRPVFAKLKQVYDNLARNWNLQWLSMGMSNDFAVAIEEGANMVRIGRAVFQESS